jgi:glutathione S-transferase
MDYAATNNIELDFRNINEDSSWKEDLMRRGGKTMVPYLFDEQTGEEMYESSDIIEYLEKQYS